MILIGIALDLQIKIFLGSIAVGAILSFLYDIFKSIRFAFKSNKQHILFYDILYFFISAFITFIFILSVNCGEIRFYIIAGEIIGFCIYCMTLSRLFMKFFICMISILKKVVNKVYLVIYIPCVSVLKKIYNRVNVFFCSKLHKNNKRHELTKN